MRFSMSLVISGLLAATLIMPVSSTTYFVDPAAGNDGNAGTSQSAAWQHVPGSYRSDNGGFLSAARWAVLRGGDTVRIKSGTTISNRLFISTSWYTGSGVKNPIVIMRDLSWGSGAVVMNGSGVSLGTWDALVTELTGGVVIDGAIADGLIIQNSPAEGIMLNGPSETNKNRGNVIRNVKFFNNLSFNVVFQSCDSFTVDNVEVDGNRQSGGNSGGFYFGGGQYACTNGLVRDCESHHNGATPGTQEGWTNARMGFWITNCQNLSFVNCWAHDNMGRGFDMGEVDPPTVITDNIKVINCTSSNNFAGFGCNLQDMSGTSRFYFINCIADHNVMGFDVYEGPSAYIYNCLMAYNGWGIYFDAPRYSLRTTSMTVKNSVFYKNSRSGSPGVDLYLYRVEGMGSLVLDYNHYEFGGQSAATSWNPGVVYDPYGYSAAQAPGSTTRSWYVNHRQDPHSLCSVDNLLARFTDETNYRLSSNSCLIGRGTPITDIPEAAFDRDGKRRSSTWDIGPYAVSSGGPTAALPKMGRQPTRAALNAVDARTFSALGQHQGTISRSRDVNPGHNRSGFAPGVGIVVPDDKSKASIRPSIR